MEGEEEQIEKQREASAVGLLFGVLMLFLAVAVLFAGITFSPAIHLLSPKPPIALPEVNTGQE